MRRVGPVLVIVLIGVAVALWLRGNVTGPTSPSGPTEDRILKLKEQIAELRQDWKGKQTEAKEKPHYARALQANARFDVYHFEEISDLPDEEADGPLDPGTLLLVLNKLARLCHGEALDPQTGELLE